MRGAGTCSQQPEPGDDRLPGACEQLPPPASHSPHLAEPRRALGLENVSAQQQLCFYR